MLDGILDALTRRRLGGAVLVLAGIIVAAVVLWPEGDDRSERPGAQGKPVRLVSIPELGLAFAHPRSWKRTVQGKVIRLRSPDGAAVLSLSSPTAGSFPERVEADLKRGLSARYSRAKIVRDGPGRLGARKVASFELRGFGPREGVRVLALIDSTVFRTYAITLLTPLRPSRSRLREVQDILATVRISEPVKVRRSR